MVRLRQTLKLFAVIAVLLVFASGCSLLSSRFVAKDPAKEGARSGRSQKQIESERADFHSAEQLFANAQYAEALGALEAYQQKYVWTSHSAQVLLYTGRSLEELGRPAEAAAPYKRILAFNGSGPNKQDVLMLQATALHRLSFVYEALGDHTKTIAALLDLQRAAGLLAQLPAPVANLELPARLAAAYLRIGNESQARSYFTQAEHALRRLSPSPRDRVWLGESLVAMGKASLAQIEIAQLADQEINCTKGFRYLIQATELNVAPHSQLASEFLASKLTGWLKQLESAESEATRPARASQLRALRTLVVVLSEAREQMLPVLDLQSRSIWQTQVRTDLDSSLTELRRRLYQGNSETVLTREALEREGEIKGVRLAEPESDPKLKKAKKRSKPDRQ